MEFRSKIKTNLNTNITVMTLLIKAFSLALKEYPIINSIYDPEKPFEYTIHKNHNINVAISS
jgi:pyruvate/2-oxoglutarate dehydrogenase complex dihydrolipoamide acyltransferase (E2) component